MTTPTVLERARDLVEPQLRKAVGSLDGRLRTQSEYHFGWTDIDGTPIQGGGGKGVRPALCVLGAEAVGAEGATAVPAAVALELIHNFSLIHDDIIDGDRTRRHRRTVWDVFGVDDAIIVGDALQALAFEVLLDEGGPQQVAAVRRLAEGTATMIAGQARDMALDRQPTATVAACLEMESMKTGALLAQATAIGATLGGGDDQLTQCLEDYGVHLGLSFQAVDDVLGIWGDPSVTGKPAGNDLRERKKSLPVALALESGGCLAEEVRRAFVSEPSETTIARLSADLADAGIREQVQRLAEHHFDQCVEALAEPRLDSAAVTELEELARFVVERDY